MPDQSVAQLLAAPFDPRRIKWLPKVVQGNRAMAIAYVDARAIVGRLDGVLGLGGWQEEYEYLSNGCMLCKLTCLIDGNWITRADVGGPSKQKDVADQCKSACSNSLKRAAVKFGIGRYLYQLPIQWVDYDPQKKQFVKQPVLPDWAIPVQAPKTKESKPCTASAVAK